MPETLKASNASTSRARRRFGDFGDKKQKPKRKHSPAQSALKSTLLLKVICAVLMLQRVAMGGVVDYCDVKYDEWAFFGMKTSANSEMTGTETGISCLVFTDGVIDDPWGAQGLTISQKCSGRYAEYYSNEFRRDASDLNALVVVSGWRNSIGTTSGSVSLYISFCEKEVIGDANY